MSEKKRVKQQLVHAHNVNCTAEGYEYWKLKSRKHLTQKGTNCSSKRDGVK